MAWIDVKIGVPIETRKENLYERIQNYMLFYCGYAVFLL